MPSSSPLSCADTDPRLHIPPPRSVELTAASVAQGFYPWLSQGLRSRASHVHRLSHFINLSSRFSLEFHWNWKTFVSFQLSCQSVHGFSQTRPFRSFQPHPVPQSPSHVQMSLMPAYCQGCCVIQAKPWCTISRFVRRSHVARRIATEFICVPGSAPRDGFPLYRCLKFEDAIFPPHARFFSSEMHIRFEPSEE